MSGKIEINGLQKVYGSFNAVDGIDLSVPAGTFVSLLGPSGCGKTTTLRMIAGFAQPTSGEIRVDGQLYSSADHVTAPQHRSMGMVFQSYAVWPHMSVFDNIAYGLRHGQNKKHVGTSLREKVLEMVALVGLSGQEDKLPSALSGGQQQRVALARALITEPNILLLDEPLSNLDAKLRESMRFELRRLQQRLGITTVFVTHSQEEALLLSDMIVVMRNGTIIERNTPERLYCEPKTQFVADFVGLANFIEGKLVSRTGELCVIESAMGTLTGTNAIGGQVGDQVLAMVRPEAIHMDKERPSGAENSFEAVVKDAHFNGNIVDYEVTVGPSVPIRVQSFAPRRFAAGERIAISFSSADTRLVERD